MGHIISELLYYLATTILDPSFDLIVLVGREVVGVTDNDLAEGELHLVRGSSASIWFSRRWNRVGRVTSA